MKIGIVTMTMGTNYGNRLQNFAVQKICEEVGIKAITYRNDKGQVTLGSKTKRIIKIILNYQKARLKLKRSIYFEDFNRKYIYFSKLQLGRARDLKQILLECDGFICGSDQIWNPYSRPTQIEFLQFAPHSRRIAFAPSLSCNEIPQNMQQQYKDWINTIQFVSVREKTGKKIIESLTGRKDIRVIPDPVLLIKREIWDDMTEDILPINKPYILVYFLGKLKNYEREKIDEYANRKGLEVISVGEDNESVWSKMDPAKFVSYIKNAKVIVTDSFHGTAFSIIYGKAFLCAKRDSKENDMTSRLHDLFNLFHLNVQLYDFRLDMEEAIVKCDMQEIDSIREKEHQKAIVFLEDAISTFRFNNQDSIETIK